METERKNMYCVWNFKPSIDYGEASVFKYNQTFEDGMALVEKFNSEEYKKESREHLKKMMPEIYDALFKAGCYDSPQIHDTYYCTRQDYGAHGESVGPYESDVKEIFEKWMNDNK